jgi:hypothetical protein
MKLSEIKAKVKKHAPELMIGALTVAGTAGWVMAGAYAVKLQNAREDDLDAWPSIEVSPSALSRVLQGATLKIRMYTPEYGGTYTQMTTDLEFPDKANEDYAKGTPGGTLFFK